MEGVKAGFACLWEWRVSDYGCIIKPGDWSFRQAVFWATHLLFQNYFPKWNIETTYFDINNPDTIESCINRIQDSFAESPTNPAVDIIDLELLGNIAKSTI
jgi:O-succinylhomoserine sulfhydrylase